LVAMAIGAVAFGARAGVAYLTTTDKPVSPVIASARAVRVQDGTTAPSNPADGPPPPTLPPGPPGCGASSPAFCEDFEAPRNTAWNRHADVSTANVSMARWRSSLASDQGHVDPGQIPACRAGADSTPLPPGASLICDPSGAIGSHYALVSTAEQ